MRILLRRLVLVIAATSVVAGAAAAPLCAQEQTAPPTPPWDVTQPRGKTRTISFTTDEGTRLSMTPMQALRTATLFPAMFIGVDQDVGSISVGKLADLVVLNSNPLDNIRNSTDIRYVMQSGSLYDGNTLDEIWPQAKPFRKFFWYMEGVQTTQPTKR